MMQESQVYADALKAIEFVGGSVIEVVDPPGSVYSRILWRDAAGYAHYLMFELKREWELARGEKPCVTLKELYPKYLQDVTQVVVAQCTPHYGASDISMRGKPYKDAKLIQPQNHG